MSDESSATWDKVNKWDKKIDREGLAIVRDNKIIDVFVTKMSVSNLKKNSTENK